MTEELSVQPTALAALHQQIASPDATVDAILLPLRALQHMGSTSADLRVHIERIRAANDVTMDDDTVESNCLLALDIISGSLSRDALRWDAAELARIYLPKAVRPEAMSRGLLTALKPSDMLPPRPKLEVTRSENMRIIERIVSRLSHHEIVPQQADFYRVPKAGMTTRPAALLAPDDRIIFEALALEIDAELAQRLPETVIWPRSADNLVSHSVFARLPKAWPEAYVIVADIESFYECIDHTLLASFISSELGKRTQYLKALESFLDATMSSRIGLPQGPNASDIFASAYLLAADSLLASQTWSFARYADDFLVGADSMVDGRRKIESLERLLRELGLRLNVSKTKVMRRDTYLANLDKPSQQVERLRKEIQSLTEARLRDSEDESEVAQILEEAGVDEQVLWDLFYNQVTTLDEVIEEVGDLFQPPLVDSYAEYFIRVARRLHRERLPEDMLGTERDLRECLVVLAGASRSVNLESVDEVLKWFPRLAQHTSAYLRSIASANGRAVSRFITRWLDPPADTDWVTAWLCNAAEVNPDLISKRLHEVMVRLVRNERFGLLTRAGAARALAAGKKLDQASFDKLLQTSTAAIRSEMILAALADPERYPSTRDAIEQAARENAWIEQGTSLLDGEDRVRIHAMYYAHRAEGVYHPSSGLIDILSGPGAKAMGLKPSPAAGQVIRAVNETRGATGTGSRNGWTFWVVDGTGRFLQSIRHKPVPGKRS